MGQSEEENPQDSMQMGAAEPKRTWLGGGELRQKRGGKSTLWGISQNPKNRRGALDAKVLRGLVLRRGERKNEAGCRVIPTSSRP